MALRDPQQQSFAPQRQARRRPSALALAQVVGIGVFLSLATLRFLVAPLDRFDEGVTLIKAALVASGHVPFRDFWATYGPLDSYLLAAAFNLFTTSVVVERLMGVLVLAAMGIVAFLITGFIKLPGGLRLLLTGLIAMVPLSVPAFNSAFLANLIGLGAVLAFLASFDRASLRWPSLAGALVGVASFARPEFAVALGGGLLIGYAVTAVADPTAIRRRLLPFLGGAVPAAIVLWLPVVLLAGTGPVWFDLVTYALELYPKARSIPFGRGDEGLVVIAFSLAFGLVWLWAALRAYHQRADRHNLGRLLGLLVAGLLLFTWVRTRADGFHAFDAWPVTALLLGLLLAGRPAPRLPPAASFQVVVSLAGILLLSVGAGGLAVRDWVRPHTDAGIPRSGISGERAWMPTPELAALIKTIDAAVPPGHPIWIGLQRNDRVTFNDTMLYFLSDREPGTIYYETLPGLTNTEKREREIACQLAAHDVNLAILGPNAAGEPWNLSSVPGSTFLDEWIAGRTLNRSEIGPYQIVRLTPGRPSDAQCRG